MKFYMQVTVQILTRGLTETGVKLNYGSVAVLGVLSFRFIDAIYKDFFENLNMDKDVFLKLHKIICLITALMLSKTKIVAGRTSVDIEAVWLTYRLTFVWYIENLRFYCSVPKNNMCPE